MDENGYRGVKAEAIKSLTAALVALINLAILPIKKEQGLG